MGNIINKKVLVYEWGSLSEPLLCDALKNVGIEYVEFARKMQDYHVDADFSKELMGMIHNYHVDVVFSYDYFPLISMICEINMIPYISWIYDCPQYTLLSKTLSNACNYIFCFDAVYAERLNAMGAVHCYHYPLAASTRMMKEIECQDDTEASKNEWRSFQCDVSFVGNLYNEEKNRLRNTTISAYTSGYIEGLIQAQLLVYGYNFIGSTLNEDVAKEVVQACDLILGDSYMQNELQMATDAIGMEITAREREAVLQAIGSELPIHLFTSSQLSNKFKDLDIKVMGYVDYRTEMPFIFHNSKINLNITSKTIETGIPQRVFDILSCGGFCLTNYQPEIAEYFVDGEELVMYTGMADLREKINYYLMHEEERKRIAERGYTKVIEQFCLEFRVKKMLEMIF